MKIAKKIAPSDHDFQSGLSGEITPANYRGRAVAFIQGRGGEGFVIRSIEGQNGALASRQQATEPQWVAWMEYFRRKDIPRRFAMSNGMATVPCEWPEQFDLDASISDRDARLQKPPAPLSYERRTEIHRKMLALAERIGVKKDRRAKDFNFADMSPAMAAAHIAEVEERLKSPVTLSSSALSTTACRGAA